MLDLFQVLRVSNVDPEFDISPDGSLLAYVLDTDGSESYHLFLFHPSTNTHTDLTPDILMHCNPISAGHRTEVNIPFLAIRS